MKKNLYYLMISLLFLGFAACSDDDDDDVDVAGTYIGTIDVVLNDDEATLTTLSNQKIVVVDTTGNKVNLKLSDFTFPIIYSGTSINASIQLVVSNVTVNGSGVVNEKKTIIDLAEGKAKDVTISATIMNGTVDVPIIVTELDIEGTIKNGKADLDIDVDASVMGNTMEIDVDFRGTK